ncbi:MAG: hypothetical protein EAZ47_05310 [Bacteroidetes bacterium]|nr:MAG: hypothetical protein EAY72_08475 [Bacteroidota bacterium]TAF93869.1 MAG: hypothetical protein EAZ47_05310 [Bacteroidota bacterium]
MIAQTGNNQNQHELFSAGFIDVVNNGQVNASSRLLKVYIGEPKKFAIPLSIYGGVTSNNFQNTSGTAILVKSNDHLVNQYINPLSGMINVSIDGTLTRKRDSAVTTKLGLIYQVGERVLHGTRIGAINNPLTGRPINFLNSFGMVGIYLQTAAWEQVNKNSMGTFFVAFRLHACSSNPNTIKQFLPDVKTNGIYYGYSTGFGIKITNVVDLRVIYYKYIKAPEIDYGLPIYQFSFNYSMSKN